MIVYIIDDYSVNLAFILLTIQDGCSWAYVNRRAGWLKICLKKLYSPGQGLTRTEMKLRPDFEAPISAAIDHLAAHSSIDQERLGIWGRSFGAYCALRGAKDPKMRACVSIGGFYDMGAIWSRMPKGTTDSICYAFGVEALGAGAELAQKYTLKGLLKQVKCPVLIVHSGLDSVCPVEESQRMIDELNEDAELIFFSRGQSCL